MVESIHPISLGVVRFSFIWGTPYIGYPYARVSYMGVPLCRGFPIKGNSHTGLSYIGVSLYGHSDIGAPLGLPYMGYTYIEDPLYRAPPI